MKLFCLTAIVLLLSCYSEPFVTDNRLLTALEWPLLKGDFPYEVQSPTDIQTFRATPLPLSPITIHLLWSMPHEAVTIENTGHYVEVLMRDDIPERPYVTGGPLFDDTYLLEQMHFHWGCEDECGSEHWINGVCLSTEAHVVLYNSKYKNFKDATNYADGVTVIAFFGKASDIDNPSFDDLIRKIPEIIEPGSETTGSFQDEFQFLQILFKQRTYYAIPGSLTTDPYQNCVTWIFYPTPFNISHKQLAAFRMLKSHDGGKMITQNDRELQEFGPRPIITPILNKTPDCED